ncbi:uncharacterized protein LOC127732364 [Mytilus californianus]|uniref:uncharacterized protein LOC127732364 n=1 Tax=Mytilus californianus TaxID=6549 RepID=UPI002245C834|nr:uncharacterized protein LOC127732364 [Mytilus californianus]XP_052097368.1 uncharacterized protein LOC127732364 [Mytilus californianus]
MRFGRRIIHVFVSVFAIIGTVYFIWLQNENSEIPKVLREKRRPKDFIDHPVFDRKTSLPILSFPKLNIFKGGTENESNKISCVKLNTFRGQTPICIFDPEIDRMISSYVKDYGTWEQDLMNETGQVLLQKPYLTFVDIGCNIGTFTLFSAKLGTRVIAIDILESALNLVHKSLLKGGLKQNVTLVLNAISDTRENVKVHVVKENPGGSYIEQNNTSDKSVDAILLDDLISLVGPGSVFLKMDIEGNEHKALKGGSRFFQVLNVEHIFMEWMLHRYSPNGKEIVHFLLRNGMLPYESLSRQTPLDLKRSYQWPDNIFWSKR